MAHGLVAGIELTARRPPARAAVRVIPLVADDEADVVQFERGRAQVVVHGVAPRYATRWETAPPAQTRTNFTRHVVEPPHPGSARRDACHFPCIARGTVSMD